MKQTQAKASDVVGTSTVIPLDDDDDKWKFYDITGEGVYTNPPDSNMIAMDHGLEEDKIWAFRMTLYNQSGIFNNYTRNIFSATKANHVPFWGLKLSTPAFYKDKKLEKYAKQWKLRLGLEQIKLRHARVIRPDDLAQRDQFKAEIQQYLADSYQKMDEELLKDVYITDHKPVDKRFSTTSEEEDEHFYRVTAAMKDHQRKKADMRRMESDNAGRFEQGSMAQQILDPLAGARKDENGTIFFKVTARELENKLIDEHLVREFE